jgi:hypothetical protein
VKQDLARRIRRDSQHVALTSARDLEELIPWPEPERRAEVLHALVADERFRDIQRMRGPDGALYFHSDAHVSCNSGRIMLRARSSDAAFAIAELVRDRSRDLPAPTKITLFDDRVFGLSRQQVEAFLGALDAPPPELADIRKLVHPSTQAVYLYSSRWMEEVTAARIMDWEEVGLARNP